MYVEEVKRESPLPRQRPPRAKRLSAAIPAKALYEYTAGSDGEVSFSEGESLVIVDNSDTDWFKVIDKDRIALVPAAYVEIGG